MAARLNPRNAESCRQKIQVKQLINRLQNHALNGSEMTVSQIDSAKFLINKRMPNPPEVRQVEGNLTLTVVTGVPNGHG